MLVVVELQVGKGQGSYMKKMGFKFQVAVAALILSLTLIFGAYELNNRLGLEKPIKTKIASIAGVEQVNLNKKNGLYEIGVKLKPVDNLPRKYQEISDVINTKLNSSEYQLKIVDRRNTKLQSAYDEIQLAIYQALDNNQYLWLEDQMQKETGRRGLSGQVFIDEERLYVEMRDGDHFLYEVITRPGLEKEMR